ncbi:MAG: DUF421 domain-containing protein [Actinobacteria bacterium]|nr:DUF421 domain-containing protein [Actinomycetota bacterium]
MGPELWHVHVFDIMLRTFVVYIVVLAGLRLAGKREIGQFTPFDLVVILLISNAVQNAMIGPDNTLFGGLVAAVTLLIVNYIVSKLVGKSTRLRGLTLGTPTLLVHDGEVIAQHLKREGVSEDELEMAVREHGIDGVSEVEMAVLEVDGSISVVPKSSIVHRSLPKRRGRYAQKKH